MKKYKYQCDNIKCNHQFIDDNPTSCPECKKDDFTIIAQVKSIQKNILISTFILVTISTIFIFFLCEDDDIITSNSLIQYSPHANYFEIVGAEGLDKFEVIELDGLNFYQDGSKIYPCNNGEFKVNGVKGDVSEEKTYNFVLIGSADIRACNDPFVILNFFPDKSTCTYILQTTDDTNALVSLNNNSGFTKKLAWTFDECVNRDYVYVKQINSEKIIKYPIEQEICPLPVEFDKNIYVNSFKLYINDIQNNRSQFITCFDLYTPKFIIDNEELDIGSFIVKISTMNVADSDAVKSLKLKHSDIEHNDNEITLKFSR